MKKIDWRLYLVADADYARGLNLLDLTVAAVEAGTTVVQLRGKQIRDREFLELGIALQTKLSKRNVPLIINDRLDIALACNASGVHLGQEDMPLAYARGLLGHGRLIGISAATLEEARRAWHGGADYIGVGPIFPTSTKESAGPPLGLEGLKEIRAAVRLPILAIGGLKPANARAVVEAGADGLAVISGLLGAADVRSAVGEFLQAFARPK